MGNAIWSSRGLNRGKAFLAKYKTGRSVKKAVHDGDTVKVDPDGHLSIRFLGIDTPEISFSHPEDGKFKNIYPHFKEYLTDPFSDKYNDSDKFKNDLGEGLVNYLQQKLGDSCAENHFNHAKSAEKELEKYIQDDVSDLSSIDKYRFFMAFAYDVMDRYGRLLCYLHPHLPPSKREGRISYNEEMLRSGKALPYFIFPNINPFRRSRGIMEAIPDPQDFKSYVDSDISLSQAREFVKAAREQKLGVFDSQNPLMLEPFELRFLARRVGPPRNVIDLTDDDPILLKPTNYYQIPNPEDRLFINPEHVLLFREKGYQVEQ